LARAAGHFRVDAPLARIESRREKAAGRVGGEHESDARVHGFQPKRGVRNRSAIGIDRCPGKRALGCRLTSSSGGKESNAESRRGGSREAEAEAHHGGWPTIARKAALEKAVASPAITAQSSIRDETRC